MKIARFVSMVSLLAFCWLEISGFLYVLLGCVFPNQLNAYQMFCLIFIGGPCCNLFVTIWLVLHFRFLEIPYFWLSLKQEFQEPGLIFAFLGFGPIIATFQFLIVWAEKREWANKEAEREI